MKNISKSSLDSPLLCVFVLLLLLSAITGAMLCISISAPINVKQDPGWEPRGTSMWVDGCGFRFLQKKGGANHLTGQTGTKMRAHTRHKLRYQTPAPGKLPAPEPSYELDLAGSLSLSCCLWEYRRL